jgi:hypothetical protein
MARAGFRLDKFLGELKRRSVFKVVSVYSITAWGVCMGAAQLLPVFDAPAWSVRLFVLFAVLGLPIVAVLAWAYEITPKGIVRDEQDAVITPAPADHRNTTVLFGAQGSVRVAWTDGQGAHERVMHQDFKLGREASCEIHLDDPMISRRHAEILYTEGRWWIRDLGSRNGTLVNGKRIDRIPLPSRCEVLLYEASAPLKVDVRAASAAQTVTSG